MLARVIYNKSHYSRHKIDNQLSRKAHTFRRRIHRRCGITITAGCICVCAFNNFVSYTPISRTHNTCAYMDANRVNRVHERVQQITWFTMPSCCRPHRLFWPVLNYSVGDRRDKAEPAARLTRRMSKSINVRLRSPVCHLVTAMPMASDDGAFIRCVVYSLSLRLE